LQRGSMVMQLFLNSLENEPVSVSQSVTKEFIQL